MAAPEIENPHNTSTPDFNRVARLYRWMEYLSFGPLLARCRFQFIDRCASARHALVLGDGDGRFTARLMAASPAVAVDAVDASTAMLAELRRRTILAAPDAEHRLRTIHADLRTFVPACEGYDLVVSHFFLDCLTECEVEKLVQRIVPHLAPQSIWILSEFSIPEKGWRRIAARALVGALYFAFRKLTNLRVRTIPDYARILTSNHFSRQQQKVSLGGLLVAEVWQQNFLPVSSADERRLPD
jgi:trans-aconitate methyltransferase